MASTEHMLPMETVIGQVQPHWGVPTEPKRNRNKTSEDLQQTCQHEIPFIQVYDHHNQTLNK